MVLLRRRTLTTALRGLPGWRVAGRTIRKRYVFDRYARGLAFTNAVARLAERANHHPDLWLRYGDVLVVLTTHDEGGLTSRDVRLARQIERLRR